MNRLAVTRIGVSVAAVAVLCLTGCSANGVPATRAQTAAADSSPGAPVKVARAEAREMPVEIAATGNVEPFSTITVKAQIGGTLVKVPFRDGDMVREGDLLFEIDSRPYQEAIRQWEAQPRARPGVAAPERSNLSQRSSPGSALWCTSRPLSETRGPRDFFPRASRTDERGSEGAALQC